MTDYDNNMRGVLFKNEDKDSDNHPDYKGQGEVDRKPVWISAWIKTSKKGVKFMSLSFQFKTAQQGGSSNKAPQPDPLDEPF